MEKQRVWIRNDQLQRLLRLFEETLGNKKKATIPVEHIISILGRGATSNDEMAAKRLIHSKLCRKWLVDIGIQAQCRVARRGVYVITVADTQKWNEATNGLRTTSQPETELVEPKCALSDDPLIPLPDPDYILPHFANDLRISIEAGERVLLVGPTGSGKSSLLKELAARAGERFMRLNLNGDTSVASLIGQWRIRNKEMVFAEGPVPTAMRLGAWLCLDEFDASPQSVIFCLQALLEDDGKLFIEETGEWLIPHPSFRIVATANSKGQGDETGNYVGVNVLSSATLDRFASFFEIDYLNHNLELNLLMKKVSGLTHRTAMQMVKVATDLRKAHGEGIVFAPTSSRRLIAWALKSVQLKDSKKAAVYTLLNRLSDDDRRVVAEVLQRHGF